MNFFAKRKEAAKKESICRLQALPLSSRLWNAASSAVPTCRVGRYRQSSEHYDLAFDMIP
jgi:hypothetical protein